MAHVCMQYQWLKQLNYTSLLRSMHFGAPQTTSAWTTHEDLENDGKDGNQLLLDASATSLLACEADVASDSD